jgi:hypothetical protein
MWIIPTNAPNADGLLGSVPSSGNSAPAESNTAAVPTAVRLDLAMTSRLYPRAQLSTPIPTPPPRCAKYAEYEYAALPVEPVVFIRGINPPPAFALPPSERTSPSSSPLPARTASFGSFVSLVERRFATATSDTPAGGLKVEPCVTVLTTPEKAEASGYKAVARSQTLRRLSGSACSGTSSTSVAPASRYVLNCPVTARTSPMTARCCQAVRSAGRSPGRRWRDQNGRSGHRCSRA